jgi:hypothetical protein
MGVIRSRITLYLIISIIINFNQFPIMVSATQLNFILPAMETIPSNEEIPNTNQYPWMTRFMDVEWEKIDNGGVGKYRRNESTDDFVSQKISTQDQIKPSHDLNDTVVDGLFHLIKEETDEDVVVLSDPGGYDNEATPLTPAKNGHWFPKMSYSRQYFDFMPEGWYASYKIHLEIEQDQDVYARYLRVKVDGTTIFTTVISYMGFHGDIETPAIYGYWEHTIQIEINYGGYCEKGWKLKYFWVYNLDGEPMDVTGGLCPKSPS